MKLYDEKDAAIIAQTINNVAPDSTEQRARLILEAALRTGLTLLDMEVAILRHREGK
jgi:hypothetical protein